MAPNSTHDEWRALQAASSDDFVATDQMYRSFQDWMQDEHTPATVCAKYYVDHTISLATRTEDREELNDFVSYFGA